MSRLNSKVALVTGASRGIGAAIAKRLAAEGADVAITYTKGADAAAAVVKEIEKTGRKAIAIQADVTDSAAVKAAVDKTVSTLGRLDVLVNNAGIAVAKKFEDQTLEELDRLIGTGRGESSAVGAEADRREHEIETLAGRPFVDDELVPAAAGDEGEPLAVGAEHERGRQRVVLAAA